MKDKPYKHLCSECDATKTCRHMFGRFWPDKSGRGVGCNTKIEPSPFYENQRTQVAEEPKKSAAPQRSYMPNLFEEE